MNGSTDLSDFLDPVSLPQADHRGGYREGQYGRYIEANEGEMPSLERPGIAIIGCGERRGDTFDDFDNAGPDAIRRQFYSLYDWHRQIRITDLGNIRPGAGLPDTIAALRTVISEVAAAGSRAVVLGGSHDLTLAQYEAFRSRSRVIEATVIDAYIDLSTDVPLRSRNFLMEMLTGEPNFIRHYNHIAFQSYLVNPHMLETMDKLRFDCIRLGHVREGIEEMEPVIRNSQMASIDMEALQHAHAPLARALPNGLSGEEACTLLSYCGMNHDLLSMGIYGYDADSDGGGQAARQAAQMLWYFIDGHRKGLEEAPFSDRDRFVEYHTAFAEVDTTFLQSRKTGRWWMQMPDRSFVPCSGRDYVLAAGNEIPERWLRVQERG